DLPDRPRARRAAVPGRHRQAQVQACGEQDGRPGRRPGPGLHARRAGDRMIGQPTAQDALKQLEPLLGEWMLEAKSPVGEPWAGEARASFEWHESHAHLVARTTVDLPDAPNTVSII